MKKPISWKKFFKGQLYIRISNDYEYKLFMKLIPSKYNYENLFIQNYDYRVDWIFGKSDRPDSNYVRFGNDNIKKLDEECNKYVRFMTEFMSKAEIEESNRLNKEREDRERELEEDKLRYYKEQEEKRKKAKEKREQMLLENQKREKEYEEYRKRVRAQEKWEKARIKQEHDEWCEREIDSYIHKNTIYLKS